MKEEKKSETFQVKGEDLIKRVKELINEDNIRRIIIKDKEAKTLIEFPLTIGVVWRSLCSDFGCCWCSCGACCRMFDNS